MQWLKRIVKNDEKGTTLNELLRLNELLLLIGVLGIVAAAIISNVPSDWTGNWTGNLTRNSENQTGRR